MYIYIYICIFAVELKAGPRFGVSSVRNWSKSSVKNWSKFFIVFHIFYSVWGVFLKTKIVSHCAKIVFCKILRMSKMRFSKRKLHFLFFFFFLFYVGE